MKKIIEETAEAVAEVAPARQGLLREPDMVPRSEYVKVMAAVHELTDQLAKTSSECKALKIAADKYNHRCEEYESILLELIRSGAVKLVLNGGTV